GRVGGTSCANPATGPPWLACNRSMVATELLGALSRRPLGWRSRSESLAAFSTAAFALAIRLGHLLARVPDFQLAQDHAGLGTVAGTEFLEDHGQVRLDGGFLDVEPVGDLLVEQAAGDEGEHTELLRGEAGQARREIGVGRGGPGSGDGAAQGGGQP